MARFRYVGQDKSGQEVKGVVEAANREAALGHLGQQLAVVTSVREESHASRGPRARRARGGELLTFTQELAATVSAAVPLPDGLELIRRSAPEGSLLRSITADLVSEVRAGRPLSHALGQHPIVPGYYVSAIGAAEAAGSLGPTLTQLAHFIKRNEEMRARIRGALMYPSLVLCFTLLISAFILTFGVAQLADIYSGMSLRLPPLTRLLVDIGTFTGGHWPLILALAAGLGLGLVSLARSRSGQLWMERQLLVSKLTNAMAEDLMASRFASTFGMLVGSGVQISQALELTAEAVGNRLVRDQVREAQRRVLEGEGLTAAVGACTYLPETLKGMIAVGEQSGSLKLTMERAAEHYTHQFETEVQELLTLLEPAVMITVGLVVSVVIVAMGLPFLNLSSSLLS